MNKKNLKFVETKLKECGVKLSSKEELEFATKQFERKGKCLAIAKRLHERDERTGEYFDYTRMIDKDTGEVDEYVWDMYFNKRDMFRRPENITYGDNMKDFLMKSQNHLIQNQNEEKYSIGRSNEVSRQIRSLNEFIENNDGLNEHNYSTHQFLYAVIKKIFKIELDNHDMTIAVKDRNFLKYFFNCEGLITSKKLFWSVFNVVYSFSNFNEFNLANWERTLSRYDRLSSDEFYADRCRLIFGDIVAKHSKLFFNNTNLNEYITMYRGFLVKPTRSVRKDRKKLNNPNAHIQDEGRGFSFTLDKPQAIRFASRYHFKTDFNFRKYLPTFFGSMSHNKIFKNLRRDYKKVLGENYNQNYFDIDTRRCVGTFRIKKKHIIAFNVLSTESEIFADPNDVELVRYDFVNDEQDTQSAVWNVRKKPAVEKQSDECLLEIQRKNDVIQNLEGHLKNFPLEMLDVFKDPSMSKEDYEKLHWKTTDLNLIT